MDSMTGLFNHVAFEGYVSEALARGSADSTFFMIDLDDFKLVNDTLYLYTAAVLFSRIKNKTADWVNLRNLWILRDCVRENYNQGIGCQAIWAISQCF